MEEFRMLETADGHSGRLFGAVAGNAEPQGGILPGDAASGASALETDIQAIREISKGKTDVKMRRQWMK